VALFDKVRQNFATEDEVAVKSLFPAKSKFQMLQMITELSPRSQPSWMILGLFRKRFKSKVLETLQEEHNVNKVAQERKGRLELSEIFTSPRKKEKDDD